MQKHVFVIILAVIILLAFSGCVDNHAGEVLPSETAEIITVPPETASPSPTPSAPPSPAPTPYDAASELLNSMTTEEKVAQLFIVRPEQLSDEAAYSLTDDMKAALSENEPGGFIFFGGNIKDERQLKEYTAALRAACRFIPFMGIDEEGGRVARLANSPVLNVENVGSMGKIGKTGDTEKAYDAGRTIGRYLSEYGFNLDFAPVADVNTNPKNPIIGDRAFGGDAYFVSDMAGELSRGLHEMGVFSVLKHFPGHGDTSGDTHTGYVAVNKTWDELQKCELIPFISNMDNADMIMVSHITLPNVTSDNLPASMSYELITGKLRGELGYEGLIITDGLEMEAVNAQYTSAEAAYTAFSAGCDILLIPADYGEAYEGLLAAVHDGRISTERLDESVLRILRLKFGVK